MSLDNKTILTGKVKVKPFAKESKSGYDAVYLVVRAKEKYVLRIKGGNPFNDPQLNELVGKKIVATGEVLDYIFMMDSWKEFK
jgi:hypothetical protein